MKLPDDAARASILGEHVQALPEELRKVDVPSLVAVTEGFTGADLKRMVEDGKAIYAYDKAKGSVLRPLTEYFHEAIDTVKTNKARYNEAITQAILNKRGGPPGAAAMARYFVSRAEE